MTKVFKIAEVNLNLPTLAELGNASLRFAIREPKIAIAAVATTIGYLAESQLAINFAVFSLGTRTVERMMGCPEDQGFKLILGPFNN
jgi:hypothetical protein